VSGALLAGLAGLAVLDSFNPATIVAISLILVGDARTPVRSALAFVAGAILTVWSLGALVFLGAGVAADAITGGVAWLRRIAFGAAAVALLVAGVRRFRDRPRKPVGLPSWFSASTALPLGILTTGADLPNAFPYFIAIERLIDAGVPAGVGLLALAGYAVVYCIPCLVLLAVGVALGSRVRDRLERLRTRFSTGVVRRSVPAALSLLALAGGVAVLAALP
jgi:hypothetical protein